MILFSKKIIKINLYVFGYAHFHQKMGKSEDIISTILGAKAN
jgi:hypothetical protein